MSDPAPASRRLPARLPGPAALLVPALALGLALPLGGSPRPAGAADPPDLGAVRRLLDDPDPSNRAAALRRLAGAAEPAALDLLVGGLADPHPYVRRAAAGLLGATDEPVRSRLERDLRRHRSATARAEACRSFALWADGRGWRALTDAARDRDAPVRAEAVRWLAVLVAPEPGSPPTPRSPRSAATGAPSRAAGPPSGPEVEAALRERLADPDGEVRALALDALSSLPDVGLPPPALLHDQDPRVRLSALEAVVAAAVRLRDDDVAVATAVSVLADPVWSVRLRAAEIAADLPDPRLLPVLVRALGDERRVVIEASHRTLVRLTGIPFDPLPEPWERWLQGDGASFDPRAAGGADPSRRGLLPGSPPERSPGPFRGSSPSPFPGPPKAGPPGNRGDTVAVPRFLGLPVVSRDVAFALDSSGSMGERLPDGRRRWDRACAELEAVLDRLGSARVGVPVRPRPGRTGLSRAAGDDPRPPGRLGRWLSAVEPAGRTALYDAIAAALEPPDVDTVVVLSDGAPSAGSFFTKTDLLEEVRRRNRWRRARIDVVSVGGDAVAERWRDVLRRLAEQSGGTWIRAE